MYKYKKSIGTSLEENKSTQGERIEQKVERITVNREPIKDGAPIIYSDRKDGVVAGYNIRTDRFEVALDAMDSVTATTRAKREGKAEMKIVKDEPIQGTEGTND